VQSDDAATNLRARREELSIEQSAVTDTLALLARIEDQQRADPANEGRWTKRVEYLRDVLDASRERIATIEAAIRELEASGEAAPAETPPTLPRAADTGLIDLRREGAERVIGAPIFKLESLPLEDFALARAFLAAKESAAWPRDRRDELRRRIGIYDRRAERDRLQARPRPSVDERRQQLLLRNVLDKCRAQAYASLTLGEIDLLIHSCDLLVQNAAEVDQDDRLFELVNRAVDEVCQRWSKLESIKDALRPRS